MNVDDIERRISELLEPHADLPQLLDDYMGDDSMVYPSPTQAWFVVQVYDEGDIPRWQHRHWVGEEYASAMLLDLFPRPTFGRLGRVAGIERSVWWYATADEDVSMEEDFEKHHPDRKTAIALAALQWLESLTPEERKNLQATSPVLEQVTGVAKQNPSTE